MKKDFVVLLVGRLFQAVLALASIRFSTTFLEKTQVGNIYLIASITSYFSLIFINPVGMFINRKLHLWHTQNQLQRMFKLVNGYFFFIAVLSIPIVFLAYHFFNIGQSIEILQLIFLVFLNIYIGTWFQSLPPILNMLEHRGAFVGFTILSSLIGLASAVLFVKIASPTAVVWLLGLLVGQVIAAVCSYIYFRKHFIFQDRPAHAGALFSRPELLAFSLPIALTTFFMWGQTQSYRLIVESNYGAEYLAVLGVCLGVAASIAGLIESLVSQYLYPQYYKKISTGSEKERADSWMWLFERAIAVYIPVTFMLCGCASYVLHILVDKKFHEFFYLVAFGSLIEFFRMTTNVLYIVSQSEMKTKSTISSYMAGAFVVVAGLWSIIHLNLPSYELWIPWVLVGGGFLSSIIMYFRMKRILAIRIQPSHILKPFFLSLPFLLFLFFVGPAVLWKDLVILFIAGCYFLVLQYYLNFRPVVADHKSP